MGIFDSFKKNKKEKIEKINTDGFDAISEECDRVYPDQKDPKHYAPMIKWKFGG